MEQYCLNIKLVLFYQRNLKIEMLKARMPYETIIKAQVLK